jgi:MATE family multidrug resistance protein
MNQEAIVADLAKPYFLWLAASMIPIAVFQHMKQYTEGMSDTKLPMLVSVYANVLNVILNYFLIFGFGDIPPMGIVGAGIATFISRCSLVVFMLYFMKKKEVHQTTLAWAKKAKYNIVEMKQLLRISFPIGVQFSFGVSAFAVAAIMIGVLGKDFLSAHEIAIRFAALSYLTASGIGAATTIRVGEFLGKKNFLELKRAANVSMGLVLVLMIFAALSFYLLRHELPLLIIDAHETAIVENASMFLLFAAIFQFSDGAQVISLGILRGIQDVKFPTFVTLTAYWIIALPLAYYLSFVLQIGPKGVWYALIMGLTVSAILLQIRLKFSYKKLEAEL